MNINQTNCDIRQPGAAYSIHLLRTSVQTEVFRFYGVGNAPRLKTGSVLLSLICRIIVFFGGRSAAAAGRRGRGLRV